jgi:hypothetical protein
VAFVTLPSSMLSEGAALFSLLRSLGRRSALVASSTLARNAQALHEMIGSTRTAMGKRVNMHGASFRRKPRSRAN